MMTSSAPVTLRATLKLAVIKQSLDLTPAVAGVARPHLLDLDGPHPIFDPVPFWLFFDLQLRYAETFAGELTKAEIHELSEAAKGCIAGLGWDVERLKAHGLTPSVAAHFAAVSSGEEFVFNGLSPYAAALVWAAMAAAPSVSSRRRLPGLNLGVGVLKSAEAEAPDAKLPPQRWVQAFDRIVLLAGLASQKRVWQHNTRTLKQFVNDASASKRRRRGAGPSQR